MGAPRGEGQTPYEFIQSFPRAMEGIKKESYELTELFVTSAYAKREYDERTLDRVRKFWQAYNRLRNRVIK